MSALFIHNPINPKLGRIVVLGQYMLYKDVIIDLADVGDLEKKESIVLEWSGCRERSTISDLFENRIYQMQSRDEIEALYDELLNSDDVMLRAAVAINGQRTEQSIQDKDALVRRYAIQGHINRCYWEAVNDGYDYDYYYSQNHDENKKLTGLLTDKDVTVRKALVSINNLDYKAVLANDKEAEVRIAVVQTSKLDDSYLTKFADDDDEMVRVAVAQHGYFLPKQLVDKLIIDDSVIVRRATVGFCHVSEEYYPNLIEDKNNEVRQEIARRGLFLDTLIEDEDAEVRRLAKKSIQEKAEREAEPKNSDGIPH